jgi:hypothetical protein
MTFPERLECSWSEVIGFPDGVPGIQTLEQRFGSFEHLIGEEERLSRVG